MMSETVSHYRVLEKLGAGGMGEVYKAYDTKLERNIALKILPPELVDNEDRVRRFIQEAKAASALNHPNIITIYEVGQTRPQPESTQTQPEVSFVAGTKASSTQSAALHYIAMEYVSGETLGGKIHRERTNLKKLIEYLIQVADGLMKAHQSGIVHRDLKPDNIMITQDGYSKILDFGIAKLIETQGAVGGDGTDVATAMMGQTRAGVVVGTVGYMSPEQAQGKIVDHRSDIFSFGCILYEAATGHKAFEGDSIIDTLHKIIYMQATPVRDFNPRCPGELQRIIRRCLVKDPEDRYQRIKDVALDLRDLLEEYNLDPYTSGVHDVSQTGSYPTGLRETLALDINPLDAKLDDTDPKVQAASRFSRWSYIWAALGVVAVIAFWPAYQRSRVGAELKLDYPREAAMVKAREALAGLGYDPAGLDRSSRFNQTEVDLNLVSASGGINEARRAVREGKVGVWTVGFIRSGSGENFPYSATNIKPDQFIVSISPRGEMVSFATSPKENIEMEPVDRDKALQIAGDAVKRWFSTDPANYFIEYVPRSNPPGVIEITWRNPDPVFHHREIVRANLQGPKLVRLSYLLQSPQSSRPPNQFAEIVDSIRVVFISLAAAAMYGLGIMFLARGRRWYAFSRVLPVVVTIMAAVGLFGIIFIQSSSHIAVEVVLGPALVAITCGIAFFPAAAGLFEWLKVTRPVRIYGAEQMVKRRFLSPSVSSSIVHGVLAGAVSAAISSMVGVVMERTPGFVPSLGAETETINAGWSAAFTFSLLGILTVFVLGISVVTEMVERIVPGKVLPTLVAALVISLPLSSGVDQPNRLIVAAGFLGTFLSMLLAVHIYRTRGFAAAWIFYVADVLLSQAATSRFLEAPSFTFQSNLMLLFLVLLLTVGVWGYVKERLVRNLGTLGVR